MFLINSNQIKLTTNLLTNKHINIQFLNNKLIIKSNPSNTNIQKLLDRNYITYKFIK